MTVKVIEQFECPKHGNVGEQRLTLSYHDEFNNVYLKSFCGRCHFDMLEACCHTVTKIDPIEIPEKETKRIITRQ